MFQYRGGPSAVNTALAFLFPIDITFLLLIVIPLFVGYGLALAGNYTYLGRHSQSPLGGFTITSFVDV